MSELRSDIIYILTFNLYIHVLVSYLLSTFLLSFFLLFYSKLSFLMLILLGSSLVYILLGLAYFWVYCLQLYYYINENTKAIAAILLKWTKAPTTQNLQPQNAQNIQNTMPNPRKLRSS